MVALKEEQSEFKYTKDWGRNYGLGAWKEIFVCQGMRYGD